MCIEYDKLMEFGVFELIEDAIVSDDKFAFREINLSRYYDSYGNFIKNVIPSVH